MTTARIAARTLVYDGWYKFFQLELDMPDGSRAQRHLLDNGSAVAVLPYDPVRRVCTLIDQPRAGVLAAGEPPLLEVIAGNLDGASPEERIVEEAMEEGGLRLSRIEHVTRIWSLPPVSTERITLYLARYSSADRVGGGGGAHDENECIRVHEIGLDDLRGMVLSGALTDAKTLILAQALLLRRPELWADPDMG
ncbi:nudix-type nucleoside diphosphatase, YffH/AdpP family [Novosphingobium sp. CF614]|uniref:NUDIX hydrolase n=1 Tax=Novosphingobium sp. CF614 TaxID=1884364 RepID=UPI0008E27D86|nr:NUDIX hydrolase [Novosphingobium sp. CF614]SFF73657.1 nudix-type nucleoside diphosphatase, YffH/AdpP family [Novosphingobium sp. CF614]